MRLISEKNVNEQGLLVVLEHFMQKLSLVAHNFLIKYLIWLVYIS